MPEGSGVLHRQPFEPRPCRRVLAEIRNSINQGRARWDKPQPVGLDPADAARPRRPGSCTCCKTGSRSHPSAEVESLAGPADRLDSTSGSGIPRPESNGSSAAKGRLRNNPDRARAGSAPRAHPRAGRTIPARSGPELAATVVAGATGRATRPQGNTAEISDSIASLGGPWPSPGCGAGSRSGNNRVLGRSGKLRRGSELKSVQREAVDRAGASGSRTASGASCEAGRAGRAHAWRVRNRVSRTFSEASSPS